MGFFEKYYFRDSVNSFVVTKSLVKIGIILFVRRHFISSENTYYRIVNFYANSYPYEDNSRNRM